MGTQEPKRVNPTCADVKKEVPSPHVEDVNKFSPQEPQYSLNDLVLHRDTKTQIERVLAHKTHSERVFNEWGLKNTHKQIDKVCINFYGLPGTGKTMAAHAVAKFLGKKLLIVNYADIESKYVGDTPKNLVAMFKAASDMDAVIFFDEADALLSRRVSNMNNSTDTSVNQTRSVLLTELNNHQKTVLFATNFIENFDPAFMRRILAHVKFNLPDYESRINLFNKYIPKEMPHAINIEDIARSYENLSGSDISNAVLMAALSAAGSHKTAVETSDLEQAIRLILDGKNANNKKGFSLEFTKSPEAGE